MCFQPFNDLLIRHGKNLCHFRSQIRRRAVFLIRLIQPGQFLLDRSNLLIQQFLLLLDLLAELIFGNLITKLLNVLIESCSLFCTGGVAGDHGIVGFHQRKLLGPALLFLELFPVIESIG